MKNKREKDPDEVKNAQKDYQRTTDLIIYLPIHIKSVSTPKKAKLYSKPSQLKQK